MAKLQKATRIKREKQRLLDIFQDLDANKLALCESLIENTAFITVSRQDLEAQLAVDGWTESYQNGREQSGLKKSAAADVYISLSKSLNSNIKLLLDQVPAAVRKSKLEELMGE